MVVSKWGRHWTISKLLSLPSGSEAGSSDIILRNNVFTVFELHPYFKNKYKVVLLNTK